MGETNRRAPSLEICHLQNIKPNNAKKELQRAVSRPRANEKQKKKKRFSSIKHFLKSVSGPCLAASSGYLQ